MTRKAPKKNSTPAQRIDCVYRRQAVIADRLTDIEAQLRLDHDTDRKTLKTQADTIARLLRQHDTLKRMPSWPQMERELIAENAYIAEPLHKPLHEYPLVSMVSEDLESTNVIDPLRPHVGDPHPTVLRDTPTESAAPAPSASVPAFLTKGPSHAYDPKFFRGNRCTRCRRLREAIEASDLPCAEAA